MQECPFQRKEDEYVIWGPNLKKSVVVWQSIHPLGILHPAYPCVRTISLRHPLTNTSPCPWTILVCFVVSMRCTNHASSCYCFALIMINPVLITLHVCYFADPYLVMCSRLVVDLLSTRKLGPDRLTLVDIVLCNLYLDWPADMIVINMRNSLWLHEYSQVRCWTLNDIMYPKSRPKASRFDMLADVLMLSETDYQRHRCCAWFGDISRAILVHLPIEPWLHYPPRLLMLSTSRVDTVPSPPFNFFRS